MPPRKRRRIHAFPLVAGGIGYSLCSVGEYPLELDPLAPNAFGASRLLGDVVTCPDCVRWPLTATGAGVVFVGAGKAEQRRQVEDVDIEQGGSL